MIAGRQTWHGWPRARARRETPPGQRTEARHGGDERADRWTRLVGENPRASGAGAPAASRERAGRSGWGNWAASGWRRGSGAWGLAGPAKDGPLGAAGPREGRPGWGFLSFEFSFYFLFFSNFNSISFLILTNYN